MQNPLEPIWPDHAHHGLSPFTSREERLQRIQKLEGWIAAAQASGDQAELSKSVLWLSELGHQHFLLKDYDEAEAAYRRSISRSEQLAENQPGLLLHLGAALAAKGDYDGAETAYRSARAQLTDDYGQSCNLSGFGHLALLRGDLEGAEGFFREALAVEHGVYVKDITDYSALALILLTRSDVDGAEEMLLKAIDLDDFLGVTHDSATLRHNLRIIRARKHG